MTLLPICLLFIIIGINFILKVCVFDKKQFNCTFAPAAAGGGVRGRRVLEYLGTQYYAYIVFILVSVSITYDCQ